MTFVFLFTTTVVLAGPGEPGGPLPPDLGDPLDPGFGGGGGAAPIDGGISLLLAAGASYGINKLYKNKKK